MKWKKPKFSEREWIGKRFILYKMSEELTELTSELLKHANKGPNIKHEKLEHLLNECDDVDKWLVKLRELLHDYQ